MLSRDELRLINEVLNEIQSTDRDDIAKLRTKLNLVVEQLDITEKAQEEMAKIQEKIVELESDSNDEEKDEKE